MFLSKYGVARHIYITVPKAGSASHAVGADWTPAAGDVKISKDGGAAANVTNLPTAIAMGNSALWDFSLTATEMQAAQVMVTVADSATKAVDDTGFIIETHGHASGQFQVDFADGVRAGLTALPNAAAEAAGGLYTRGSGAGQINQPANGQVDANTVKVGGTTQTARDLGASVLLSAGSGTGQLDFTSGVVKSNATQILGGAIPAVNVTGVPLVDLKYTLGTISPATAGSVRADSVTGAVGSVTGAVGSVTGAVGSVTGNVGGNVVGSVASVTAAVAITSNVKKNQALAKFAFLMTDSTNHNPATGKAVTVTRSIDGAAFGAGTLSAVTEVSNGMYTVDFVAGDLNGNVIVLRATAASCDDTFERFETQP